MGNLCKPLCSENEIHSITCSPQQSGKEFVFTAKWNNRLVVFKSSHSRDRFGWENITRSGKLENNFPPKEDRSRTVPRASKRAQDKESRIREMKNYKRRKRVDEATVKEANEKHFESIIRDIVNEKLNLTVTNSQIESLKYLETKNKFLYSEFSEARKTEKANLYRLLQSREYIMSQLFSDREMFPQIIGTCGHFYVVEHLRSPQFNSFFMLDDKEEWSERMKLAIEIMDFVEELETNFPDALHMCDIKMSHFGVTNTGRLKFLDLDSVYTNNVIEKLASSGKPCQENADCDLLDCKSVCNARTKICDGGIANNNLQVICEKIFVGWTMSGKVIVPGLLMSEHTPASLATLLRLCAENGRAPVPEDVRQRLYTTLTEMYQILTQRLSM
ncbi:UNVERIFIED_CONTAM: hypothetical protein PYX00_008594 [Menopon gallinae]|uniref:Protein FAM69C n=1 Tax=Menopon gallinae TaxID=328185 RepID=A0AAW2HNV3_9NEOP